MNMTFVVYYSLERFHNLSNSSIVY